MPHRISVEPDRDADAPDPAWITFSPDKKFLYAINATEAQAIAFAVDPATIVRSRYPNTQFVTSYRGTLGSAVFVEAQ